LRDDAEDQMPVATSWFLPVIGPRRVAWSRLLQHTQADPCDADHDETP